MNTPGRTLRPLPHSSIGAIPDTVTRDQLAAQLDRLQTIGRSPVGQEAARRTLAMVDRYAESFRSLPAQRTVPDMRQSPPNTADQDQQLAQLRELAASRGTALREANERIAELNGAIETAKVDTAHMVSQLDELREAARSADSSAAEVDAAWAEAQRVTLELEGAHRDMDVLAWLHAEAVHQLSSAHLAADYCAAQATRRAEELDRARAEFAADRVALSDLLRGMARRTGSVRKDLRNRIRLEWHCNSPDCHRGHESDWQGSYYECLDCSTEDRLVQWYQCDNNTPTVAQLRAAATKFDERLSDVQEEHRKALASWDRTRTRMDEQIALGRWLLAELAWQLDSHPLPTLRPSVTLTDEQIEQLRADLAAFMNEPYQRLVVSSEDTIPDVTPLDPETSKQCSTCGLVKPLEEFYVRSSSDPTHRHAACKSCDNERRRSRRLAQENS